VIHTVGLKDRVRFFWRRVDHLENAMGHLITIEDEYAVEVAKELAEAIGRPFPKEEKKRRIGAAA
jgi:hypothetical protein